jgi:hypothetical protein
VNYFRSKAFKSSYRSIGIRRQVTVDATLLKLAETFSKRRMAPGLGIKPLQHGIWEVRAGISDRILFRKPSGNLAISGIPHKGFTGS